MRLASDGQVGFDPPEVVAGQGQVGLLPVEDQVKEQALPRALFMVFA
jgi:hypothetical protein